MCNKNTSIKEDMMYWASPLKRVNEKMPARLIFSNKITEIQKVISSDFDVGIFDLLVIRNTKRMLESIIRI